MMKTRSNGVLCHVSSLPSPYGIGDLGPSAWRFVDILAQAGQRWWQVLPLNATDNALANSPYSSFSAFAFNKLFISPEMLVLEGFLESKDLEGLAPYPDDTVDFNRVYVDKDRLIRLAFARYQRRLFPLKSFDIFCADQAFWLNDVALFSVLKNRFSNTCWSDWPTSFRDRHPGALREVQLQEGEALEREKFTQYLFYRQWMALQDHCSAKGVGLIGDIPIYVNYDSVDVWVSPQFFKLDSQRRQTLVAGVPPDYFSKDGQRWGNPVYDWEALRAARFSWWVDRLRHNLALFDAVRIDHFRAFAQCWEIPAEEKTAIHGKWQDVPGGELFTELARVFPQLPIIAEDLGIITKDVDDLKERFGFPGMRVVMFAFHNEYKKSRDLPENYAPLSVVYTGTHDNNTVRGWFLNDMTPIEMKNMTEYFGTVPEADQIHWTMIRLAMMSPAVLCVVPVQDILGLGSEARMNKPSTVSGNWCWRFPLSAFTPEVITRLHEITAASQR